MRICYSLKPDTNISVTGCLIYEDRADILEDQLNYMCGTSVSLPGSIHILKARHSSVRNTGLEIAPHLEKSFYRSCLLPIPIDV